MLIIFAEKKSLGCAQTGCRSDHRFRGNPCFNMWIFQVEFEVSARSLQKKRRCLIGLRRAATERFPEFATDEQTRPRFDRGGKCRSTIAGAISDKKAISLSNQVHI